MNWKSAAIIAGAILFGAGLSAPWAQPATLVQILFGTSVVSASNPLPVQTAGAAATIGITPTDRTVTSATGSSQTLMAANTARHSLNVVNTGNANCGINPTGGTAAIGGAGTLTLAPLGNYSPHIPTLSAVTIICTAAQPVYADEN
jgi:hypothetical protein